MMTKLPSRLSLAGWNRKISPSGAFITTPIFSARQLRAEKMRLQAILTVITASAHRILSFSRNFSSRTLRLCSSRLNIVTINSGIGSCWSRMTLAPRSFGTKELKTRTSGMLCTYTSS